MPWVAPLTAAAEVGDAASLGALGAALITEREPSMAASVLARARKLGQDDARWLTERVAALELLGRNAEAVAELRAGGSAAEGFLARHLLAFNTLSGD